MVTMKKKVDTAVYLSVAEELKCHYMDNLLRLEEFYKFNELQAPRMQESDFDSVPMILFIGQYSTGKTSLIKYLLNADYPGIRIGPEPTTDGFNVIMHGETERVIPGNALVSDKSKQFCSLDYFGNSFLNRLSCAETNNDFLQKVTLVDTPGILAGDKQTIQRGYDFTGVVTWFAERCDLIMLLFDSHKLDISDEFKKTIETLRPYDSKIRLILNKADSVTNQQLMRVYGALMWSLGKVILTPEVTRVYIGSFWDGALSNVDFRDLFQLEQDDLLEEIRTLPKNSTIRKLNDFIKRIRYAIINAYIISSLAKEMPIFGKDKKKAELIKNLDEIYKRIQFEKSISPGDFPPVEHMRKVLVNVDFSKLKPYNQKLIDRASDLLYNKVPDLLKRIPEENQVTAEERAIKGGIFSEKIGKYHTENEYNPFSAGAEVGINFGRSCDDWIVNKFREPFDQVFDSHRPSGGLLDGHVVREELMKTKLSNKVLAQAWNLVDTDRDGKLSRDEFALIHYLCKLSHEGVPMPEELPDHLKIPHSSRSMAA